MGISWSWLGYESVQGGISTKFDIKLVNVSDNNDTAHNNTTYT